MPTIDANVWVAAFDTKDRFHDESVAFLRSLAGAETIIRAPAIAILEVACAIARRFADPAMGHKAAAKMKANMLLHLEPLDEGLLSEALRLGTKFRLRASYPAGCGWSSSARSGRLPAWRARAISLQDHSSRNFCDRATFGG